MANSTRALPPHLSLQKLFKLIALKLDSPLFYAAGRQSLSWQKPTEGRFQMPSYRLLPKPVICETGGSGQTLLWFLPLICKARFILPKAKPKQEDF